MVFYKKHYKALFQVGLPIVIGQVGMIILGFADTLMIGHHNTNELSAAGFVNNIFNLAIIFCTGFSYGLTPIVGSLFGSGNHTAIGRLVKNSLLANAVIAVFICAAMSILYLNIDKLGQPEELLPLMHPYYLTLLSSLPFILLFNTFKQFADGITDTRSSMWILISGNVINIIGNFILIFGLSGFPELGLLGAGIATLLSRILMCVAFAILFFFTRHYHIYLNGFKTTRINTNDFKRLNSMGWPIALQMGMETASFSLCAVMLGWLGSAALAAHQIMCTIGTLCFMIYYGIGAAVAIRVSYFKGQNDHINVRRSAYAGFHLILLAGVIASSVIFLLRHQLGGYFTDSDEVDQLVVALIFPMLLYQLGDGMQINFANALRGIADVKPMMLFAFISYFMVSLPFSYFFGFILDMGTVGVWLGLPLGLTCAGILFFTRFQRKTRITA